MLGVVAGTTITVLSLAALSGGTTLLGTILALRTSMHPRFVSAGLGFSAGMMISLAVLELVPDAFGLGGAGATGIGLAVGSSILALVRGSMTRRASIGSLQESGLRAAYLVAVGLILHDVPEGFAMANAYLVTPSSGVTLAVAIAVHNVPEEFAMALPAATLASRHLLYRAAVASALAEPVGAGAGLIGVARLPGLHPIFLGVAAGAMIFVAVSELIPMVHRMRASVPAAVGGLLSLGVYGILSGVIGK